VIAVCFSLATVILPSLQRCLQRVVAKEANKMAAFKMAAVSSNCNPERTSIF
jgi:hypothetical protein